MSAPARRRDGRYDPLGGDGADHVRFKRGDLRDPEGNLGAQDGGNKLDILPSEIHLTLGVRNILVLKNMDDVPQVFGPALMMPGQTFRLPFELASSYQFACTAHASGQMTIVVAPMPASPLARLRWRLKALLMAAQRS